MDWMERHHCNISLAKGAMFVESRFIPLIIVKENVVIQSRSQCDVLTDTIYADLSTTASAWCTDTAGCTLGSCNRIRETNIHIGPCY